MMTKLLGHISLTGLIAGMILASCSSDDNITQATMPAEDGPIVNLSFSVVVHDAADNSSRSSVVTIPDKDNFFEGVDSKYEKIHTLRVIILHQDDETVEHNKVFTLSEDGDVRYDYMKFKVRGGEKKRIYLFANEQSIDYNFDNLKVNSRFPTSEIADLTIQATDGLLIDNTGTEKRYIPMSEVWSDIDIKMPQNPEDYNQTLSPLFLTRAGVKFTFTVKALDGAGLALSKISFNRLADKQYLLPRDTKYSPEKGKPSISNFPADPDADIPGRFITEYKVPADTTHSTYDFTVNNVELDGLDGTTPEKTYTWYKPMYFCESGYDKPYSVAITVASKSTDKDGKVIYTDPYTFTPKELDNLPILPRNTHVKVNITLGKAGITCDVKLIPYTEIILNPDFGLDVRTVR